MKTLDQIKSESIVERLTFFKGNRTLTAQTLGVTIRGLSNQLKAIRIKYPTFIIPEARDNTDAYFRNVTYGPDQIKIRGYKKAYVGRKIYV